MKKLLLLAGTLFLAACSSDLESGDYNPDDYEYSLESSSGEEVEVFTADQPDLYLYFTGVT
ncbi:hypothetical protein FLK61_36480 [Paenalkalicoccus suaedae]|uniref:Uncharacterized protein n=1 Tax=Paenalkalicoccus suaedae TaxID=2592382 RepID=A0A859FIQ0_9BACI|nr:hypothetical protein [Paenalkalicoccus suaedae]QKS72156.1 hypothetical protein FLK61_36480 [Paenalkalicoccus suaedae]